MGKQAADKIIKDFLEEIIKQIGLKAEIEVSETDEAVNVLINGDELGALIGYHGETLESLQLILSLMLNRENKEGEWKRVLVDIGNWRSERAEALKVMIDRAVEDLTSSKLEKVALPVMSSSQRREAHVIISENHPDISSESEGEEPNRRILLHKN